MLPYNLFLIPSSHIIIFPLHKYLPCLSCLSLLCLFCVIWFLIHINSINCKLLDFPNRTVVLFFHNLSRDDVCFPQFYYT
jgi:hypothetical protein